MDSRRHFTLTSAKRRSDRLSKLAAPSWLAPGDLRKAHDMTRPEQNVPSPSGRGTEPAPDLIRGVRALGFSACGNGNCGDFDSLRNRF